MKQLLYIFCAALFVTACKKDTVKVFEETPEERMSARINELNAALIGSEHGWKASLTTSAKGGYGFYMDFDPSQSIVMVGDLNDESATKSKISTFRIKWVMNATLIFDTYNYISMLQDPSPAVYGGAPGSGLQSDVEFEYQRINGDSIILRGFKYQNYFILVKATAEQKNRYLSAAFKANIDEINNYFTVKLNNYINVAGLNNQVEFILNKSTKIAKFQYMDNNGNLIQVTGKYNFEDIGINFAEGFVVNGITFVKGKMENGEFVLYAADGTKYVLKQNSLPILPMKVLFAYNGIYKELYIGSSLPAGVTSGFNAAYTACASKFTAFGRTLLDVRFIFANSTTATVTIRNTGATGTFTGNATFKYTYANGVITLSSPTYDPNWSNRIAQLIDLQNYFTTDATFKVEYVQSSNPSVIGLGGLYKVSDNTSFFYGSLR